jgi:hypothetical protein
VASYWLVWAVAATEHERAKKKDSCLDRSKRVRPSHSTPATSFSQRTLPLKAVMPWLASGMLVAADGSG